MMKQVFQDFYVLNKSSPENHSLEAVIICSLIKYVLIFQPVFFSFTYRYSRVVLQ